jgi:hypothetical protein
MLDHPGVNAQKPAENLLTQIARIPTMERGKLSVMRETSTGPAYKLQAWENGKNLSRYIPPEQAPAVREAIDGYARFQALIGQYVDQVVQRTRAELASAVKKTKHRPKSSSRRTPKSAS